MMRMRSSRACVGQDERFQQCFETLSGPLGLSQRLHPFGAVKANRAALRRNTTPVRAIHFYNLSVMEGRIRRRSGMATVAAGLRLFRCRQNDTKVEGAVPQRVPSWEHRGFPSYPISRQPTQSTKRDRDSVSSFSQWCFPGAVSKKSVSDRISHWSECFGHRYFPVRMLRLAMPVEARSPVTRGDVTLSGFRLATHGRPNLATEAP
jgi:hypothetical protein